MQQFFDEVEGRTPTIVSWNGSAFELPVIHYRALKNSISAPAYWEKGENNADFRQDNYLSRHHERHTDLKDVLASYNKQASAPLDDIARLLGFPGKIGKGGSLSADGSLPAEGSLLAEGSLPANGSLPAEGSLPANGSQVWDHYQAGNIKGIRSYCETDVLNTYLIYLRYQLMRGEIKADALEKEFNLLREVLDNEGQQGKAHLLELSKHWA